MNTYAKRALVGSLALTAGFVTTAAFAADVTYERLLKPEDGNWLTHNRTYEGHRYSPLNEITTGNVGGLHVAFALSLIPQIPSESGGGGMQGTPLVDDGIVYMVDGAGVVYRIDATNGRQGYINWIMNPDTPPESLTTWHGNNKGVALLGDKVYSITGDGYLIATDAATGEQLWQVATKQDPDEGFSMAPIALKDKIIMGPTGDTPMRGRLEARSAEDGSPVWTFWSVPGPGEPGHETWPADNDAWLSGGASFWVTGIYDTDSNQLYYGVSNPYPYDPAARPGDNLYSSSTVALDADSGKLNWYFQYTPNDQWDYDEEGSQLLYKVGDEKRLGHFGRNGFYYTMNAANGQFETATAYVDKVTWTAGIDPKTGKPVEYDPALGAASAQKYALAGFQAKTPMDEVCPGLQGGNNHWPTSFSDRTNMAYGTAIEGCYANGKAFPLPMTTGSIEAMDTDGKVAQKVALPFAPYGGIMTTAGGLVFSSTTNGDFFAMDDTSLKTLWSINLGSTIEAPPVAYAVNGKEYIVLPVATSAVLGNKYPAQGNDPNAASLANIQRTWELFFFTL